ncbi:SpoIIE family protein phosphatase [Kitasatospora sp. MAP5-34]|uniref:SpoIIE family protein phosphatase n=1 Tax=Kitasatospora sp. MAP5-34 TaxID=3035102 RepID=UPI0024767F1C|nr:SpoIIE family protein phosphatase [Kitasatospora sp. MAP5-34]MDH6576908.1 serine phosphatase RsbU (regulator of sigma subunit) [Kitasatospora sp. MAP5-34]
MRRAIEEDAVHPKASGRDALADALIDSAADALATSNPDLLRAVVEDAPVGLALVGPDLRWQYLNPAFALATGLGAADLGSDAPVSGDMLRQVLADGHPRELTIGAPGGPGGLPVRCQRLVVDGQVAGLLLVVLSPTDPPDRQQNDRRQDDRQQDERRQDDHRRHELTQARARLAMLDTAAERIGTTLDVDTTCAELAQFTVPAMADLAAVDVLPPDTAEHRSGPPSGLPRLRRAAVACAPALRARAEAFTLPGGPVRYREGSAVARSLEQGRAVIADVRSDEELARSAGHPASQAAYGSVGVGSILAVPLFARGQLIGVLSLARVRGTSEGFTADDAELIDALARRAATSIDNARRFARSQGIAVELQRALLAEPGNPHPNLELASRYLPSGTSSVVGGDWYETVRLPFGRTLLVMGDVMGHGVEAAVDMSYYRSTLRYVAAMDLPPHRILRQLDEVISESDSARPATCLLALADPARNRWTFSSAGHLPPALITADRPTELIEVPTGPPLGTGFGGYEQNTRELLPGQVLLLYTDGLVERRGEDIDASLARLAALRLPAAGALDHVLDAVLDGVTPHAAEDDIALLAARVRPR